MAERIPFSKTDTVDRLDRMLSDGMYLEDIAKELDLTYKYVLNLCYQHKWKDRIKRKPIEGETKLEYRDIRKIPLPADGKKPTKEEFRSCCESFTIREIAEIYGITDKGVYYWCKKYDCKPRSESMQTPKQRKEINMDYVKECLRLGLHLDEIAGMINVSAGTISNRLKEEGLSVDDIIRKNPHTAAQRTGHNCNPKAKRHDCKYWDHGCRCCDYLCKTGTRRPCPAWDCTVYEKGGRTKDKPNNIPF